MSFHYWYRDDDGDVVEIVSRVQLGGSDQPGTDGLVMNAEEGSVGTSSVTIDDTEGAFAISGHRLFYVTEDECAGDDYGGIVYDGYTWVRTYSREREFIGPGRTIVAELNDINTIFERRIMDGADANRPAETDIERITWALSTNEASLIDDSTYFSTDGPVDMDAADYRGQGFRNILDDCAQQSGKNWFLWRSSAGRSFWYMPKYTTDFASAIKISNDPAEEDLDETGAGTIFPPSSTTTLRRDPSRVYSGTYLNYAASHVYVQREATAAAFARRDSVTAAPNVKTKTKALARANRVLTDVSTEEDVISTAILVPRAQTNDVVEGQRIQAHFTHLVPEGYADDYVWCRVLNRTVREKGPGKVELALQLTPDEAVGGPPAGTVYGIIRRSVISGLYNTRFAFVGDSPQPGYPTQPTVGLIETIVDAAPQYPGYALAGWRMLGSGTIDVTFCTTTAGVGGAIDCTFSITKNGVPVASEVVSDSNSGLHFIGLDGLVTITGLAVVAGDDIRATITPSTIPYFWRSPRGTGQAGERLEITGGSLS